MLNSSLALTSTPAFSRSAKDLEMQVSKAEFVVKKRQHLTFDNSRF